MEVELTKLGLVKLETLKYGDCFMLNHQEPVYMSTSYKFPHADEEVEETLCVHLTGANVGATSDIDPTTMVSPINLKLVEVERG